MTQQNDKNGTGPAAKNLSRAPIVDWSALRPQAERRRKDKPSGAGSGPKTIAEQITELERRWASSPGHEKDLIFLISNSDGVKDDSAIRNAIDTVASACLVDYRPLKPGKRGVGGATTHPHDVSHLPPAMWIPCRTLDFGDTNEALVMARNIEYEIFEPLFHGFLIDIPLESRGVSATFITGNPGPGHAFIDALDRSLMMDNKFVAHWNEDCLRTWVLFCFPATPDEIANSGLRLDPPVYHRKRPGKSASL